MENSHGGAETPPRKHNDNEFIRLILFFAFSRNQQTKSAAYLGSDDCAATMEAPPK